MLEATATPFGPPGRSRAALLLGAWSACLGCHAVEPDATPPPTEVLQLGSTTPDTDRGFLAPKDYGGFAFNRYFLRGFANESALRNGFRDYGYLAPSDYANISEIEVLKGPASALYGNGKPGGDLNTVTNRIDGSADRETSVEVNSYGFTRLQLNLGGRFGGAQGATAYRFDAAAQSGRSFRDLVGGTRLFLAPSVAFALGSQTRLSVEAEIFRRSSTWDPLFIPDAFLLSLPVQRFVGEFYNGEQTRGDTLRVALTHTLSSAIRLRQAIYLHNGRNRHEAAVYDTYGLTSDTLVQADGFTISRVSERAVDQRKFRVFQSEAYVDWRLFDLPQSSVLGIELGKFDYRFDLSVAPIAGLNGLDPRYGALPGAYDPMASQKYGTFTRVAYLGDRVQLSDAARLYLGVRIERFRTYLEDELESPGTTSVRSNTVVSPRLGATLAATAESTLFFSVTHAARPQIGTRSASGEIFAEEVDSQVEFGVQSSWLERKLHSTVSIFRMRRGNVLTTDPTSPNFSVASGERESRGIELDVNGRAGPLAVNLSAALTDARVSHDVSLPQGSRLPGVSKVFVSAYLGYKWSERWSFGSGLLYQGSAETTLPSNGLRLPALTTVDVSATYQSEASWFAKLSVANLFDRRGFTSYGFDIKPVAPRTAQIFVGTDF